MAPLFATAWENSLCIYCNSPVGSDGETDDGEFYYCAVCQDEFERSRETLYIANRSDIDEEDSHVLDIYMAA